MDQDVIIDYAERFIREFRQIVPPQQNEAVYEDRLEMLFSLLFTDSGLSALGRLSTIDALEQILEENGFAEGPYAKHLLQLQEHRNIMAHTHAKLAAVLNLKVDIRDLLYFTLDDWPQLSQPIGFVFSEEFVQELQSLRLSSEKPSDCLNYFFTKYFKILTESEAAESVNSIRQSIDTALTCYTAEEQQATVHALFADRSGHQGYCYRVTLHISPGSGGVHTNSDVDEEMKKAARTGATYALVAGRFLIDRYHIIWSISEPLSYEGRSIGLAIAIGTLSKLHERYIDAYTAFTGTVSDDGHIGRVGHLTAKLAAAQKAGFQRVLLPRENWEEAKPWVTDAFSPIAVDSINEAWQILNTSPATLPHVTSLIGRVRHFCYECERVGAQMSQEKRPNFLRLRVTDYKSEVLVDLYQGKAGTKPVIGGNKNTPLASSVKLIVDKVFGTDSISPSQQNMQKFVTSQEGLSRPS